jgi:hypothetical protein
LRLCERKEVARKGAKGAKDFCSSALRILGAMVSCLAFDPASFSLLKKYEQRSLNNQYDYA